MHIAGKPETSITYEKIQILLKGEFQSRREKGQ
jgi:hypothetical protein